MADLRIKWESPLNLSVVDSIAIYRYEGLTSDCAVLTDQGTLLTESLPASQTEYDDLSMPEMGLVTYGVFSKNVTGLSQCAVAQLQMPPTTSKKPLDLTAVYLDASNSPTNLITRGDPELTVGPTSVMAALEISPLYGIDGGYYIYPLFASLSESDYLDAQNGGSGSSHSHTMTYNNVDYYMPNTGGTHAGNSIPASFQINGFTFNYTKIDTGTEVARLDETEEGPIDLAVTTVSPILNESPTAITATEQSLAPVANQAPTSITATEQVAAPVANQAPTSITATEVVAPVANQAPTSIEAVEQGPALSDSQFQTALALWFSNENQAIATYGHISNWNVSQVTNMEEAFRHKSTFDEDLSNWDVSSVTSMKWMFQHAYAFQSDGMTLSGWDTGNVTNMQNMFWNCQYFCYDLSGWDVANVTVCSNFNGGNCCSSITVPNFTNCTI